MTYIVSSGALNSTHSLTHLIRAESFAPGFSKAVIVFRTQMIKKLIIQASVTFICSILNCLFMPSMPACTAWIIFACRSPRLQLRSWDMIVTLSEGDESAGPNWTGGEWFWAVFHVCFRSGGLILTLFMGVGVIVGFWWIIIFFGGPHRQ